MFSLEWESNPQLTRLQSHILSRCATQKGPEIEFQNTTQYGRTYSNELWPITLLR